MRDEVLRSPATLGVGWSVRRRWTALGTGVRYVVLLIAGATMIVPFLWMFATSLKPAGSVLTVPPELIPRSPTFESYRRVADAVPLVRMFGNSVLATTLSVAGQVVT